LISIPAAIKQKIELLIGEGNKGGGNNIKKDFMKIYGVKLSQPMGFNSGEKP
jgi:hypothetical protein